MNMRTKNSIKNIIVSCVSYGIIMVGSFITRKMFAQVLGLELVGIEGAFLNVVSALAIVEMGLGVGIVYKLYKPIAQKDWNQVSVILCFLRKSYIIISSLVITCGLIASYFVVQPIKEDFPKIWLSEIFVLYVLDVAASYLFSHKRSMFIADQKNYVNNLIHICGQVLMFGSQIAVLQLFGSFEGYLICKIFFRLLENILISYRFDKNYSFINLKNKDSLPEIEKRDLFKNIKAMLFHKVAGFGSTSASSLIIVYGVGLKENGVYYNYTLIVMAITTITNEIFNGILASFGNLLNTAKSRTKIYDNFNALYFLNFLLYSFIISAFICVITPFIELWTGSGSAFNMWTTVFIAGYLYIYGIRQSISMAKIGAGIYDPDKYPAMLGAAVTILSSFLLVKPLGISGVMLGNIIGLFSASHWTQPYLVYNMVFRKEVKSYHYKFVLYMVMTAGYAYLSYISCNRIMIIENFKTYLVKYLIDFSINERSAEYISQIFVNFIICLVIPNVLNILFFCRTSEFKQLFSKAKSLIGKSKMS